jgi:hypothetical protein
MEASRSTESLSRSTLDLPERSSRSSLDETDIGSSTGCCSSCSGSGCSGGCSGGCACGGDDDDDDDDDDDISSHAATHWRFVTAHAEQKVSQDCKRPECIDTPCIFQ